jgi:hypothetical protein
MQNNYLKISLAVFMVFSVRLYSQCTSCTTTISGNDPSNYVVNSGNTLCVASSGNATGLITVGTGGILCNQGSINSTNLWVAGGVLNNYGTINTDKILVSGQGDFYNYGVVTMDSLLVTNIYSFLSNLGSISGIRLGNSDNSDIKNAGNITVDYMADSNASFSNYANGSFIVNYDFANSYTSHFSNSGYYKVMRDFYNSTNSTFETTCMGIVGRDWYNSALFLGSSSSCGGFNIAGASYNSGTIGSPFHNTDICDAGNPALGLDGPGGTIAATTSYCACSNSCVQLPNGIKPIQASDVIVVSLYPNPAINLVSLTINARRTETITIEVFDMMGKKQLTRTISSNVGENKLDLDIAELAQGTYILNIIDEKQLMTKQMFSVLK